MAANKFKVGDKVRVKRGLADVGCCLATDEMKKMEGEILSIENVKSIFGNFYTVYTVKGNKFGWCDEMLEPVKNLSVHSLMPEIVDYKYNSETGETYIKWADKTETRVKPESDTEPNQYVGFVTAYAKKAAGNTSRINSLFEKWAIKKPIRDEKSEKRRFAEEAEAQRVFEKRRAKREKWLIRREALRIKREYEAKKLAYEKYGIPMDDVDDKPKKKKGDKK